MGGGGSSPSFYILLYTYQRSAEIAKFFFRFLVDLYILGRPENDLTIFCKMFVRLLFCVCHNCCGRSTSRTNVQNLIKLCVLLDLDRNWCWLDLSVYYLISVLAMLNFSRFSELMHEML